MRGYFGFGAEGISKPMNMGNLVRSAHAFGAQFVFTVSAHYSVKEGKSMASSINSTPTNLHLFGKIISSQLSQSYQGK